jgi:hypothetical protein
MMRRLEDLTSQGIHLEKFCCFECRDAMCESGEFLLQFLLLGKMLLVLLLCVLQNDFTVGDIVDEQERVIAYGGGGIVEGSLGRHLEYNAYGTPFSDLPTFVKYGIEPSITLNLMNF